MIEEQKTISNKLIDKNPYWEYHIDEYALSNGKIYNYYFVNTPGSTFVIPKNDKNNYILTKQYRYLNKRFSIEFPGGGQKSDLSSLQNAINELSEETGYFPKNITKIGEFNPFNGVTNEICSVYLATDLELKQQNLDETEQIEIIELTDNQINQMISSGEIWDGMTLAAWAIYNFSKEKK